MTQRKRRLTESDLARRGLIAYVRSCPELAEALSARCVLLDDGRRVVVVCSAALAIDARLVTGSRLRKIPLPPEFW